LVVYQLPSVHIGKWFEPIMFNSYNDDNVMNKT